MAKIKVDFVKYDMDKTKNRKRKNLLVNEKSEASVITQLQKIHKNEKVVEIFEIIWNEDQVIEDDSMNEEIRKHNMYSGNIKFFDPDKGFGFIVPDDEDMDDIFFHVSALKFKDASENDRVEFEVSEAPKGLSAIKISRCI